MKQLRARKRVASRRLPRDVVADPARGDRRGCALSAHCGTGRAGSKMLVRPRMQSWPVGLPFGHVLLLHAHAGTAA
jgi:hypothetical protein